MKFIKLACRILFLSMLFLPVIVAFFLMLDYHLTGGTGYSYNFMVIVIAIAVAGGGFLLISEVLFYRQELKDLDKY